MIFSCEIFFWDSWRYIYFPCELFLAGDNGRPACWLLVQKDSWQEKTDRDKQGVDLYFIFYTLYFIRFTLYFKAYPSP